MAETDVTDESLGIRLLSDIRDIFDSKGTDRIHSDHLQAALLGHEESPWNDLKYSASKIARRLRDYGIRSTQMRIEGANKKGYLRESFEDAWATYLPKRAAGLTDHEAAEPAQAKTPDQFAWLDELRDE